MDEELEIERNSIVNNVDAVLAMIDKINSALSTNLPKPHNPYSYYYTGHCNLYAKILSDIFGEYSTVYDKSSHVITKIGSHYYDVRGLVDGMYDMNEFYETPKEWLTEPMAISVGNYNSLDDDPLIQIGIDAGLEYLKERCEYKSKLQ